MDSSRGRNISKMIWRNRWSPELEVKGHSLNLFFAVYCKEFSYASRKKIKFFLHLIYNDHILCSIHIYAIFKLCLLKVCFYSGLLREHRAVLNDFSFSIRPQHQKMWIKRKCAENENTFFSMSSFMELTWKVKQDTASEGRRGKELQRSAGKLYNSHVIYIIYNLYILSHVHSSFLGLTHKERTNLQQFFQNMSINFVFLGEKLSTSTHFSSLLLLLNRREPLITHFRQI